LSSRLGVWDVVGYDRQRDEDLAEDFVAFMGDALPGRELAEDLAFHRWFAYRTPPRARSPLAEHPGQGRNRGAAGRGAQRFGQHEPATGKRPARPREPAAVSAAAPATLQRSSAAAATSSSRPRKLGPMTARLPSIRFAGLLALAACAAHGPGPAARSTVCGA